MELKTTKVKNCPPDLVSSGWRIDLFLDGKSVSRLWIADKWMRIGGTVIKIGGISTVGTDIAFRGRGFSSLVMQAALALMKKKGYALSLLHGIPGFYHRFGYACCMPDYVLRLPVSKRTVAQISKLERGKIRLRALASKDLASIARLYNREQNRRTGSLVRNPKRWPGFLRCVGWSSKANVRVAVDEKDIIRGYLVYDRDSKINRVSEIGGTQPEVFASFLKFLSRRNKSSLRSEITMVMPPDHAFTLYCLGFGGETTVSYPDQGEFMGRVVNATTFKKKILSTKGMSASLRKIGLKMDPNKLLTLAMGYQDMGSLAFQNKKKLARNEIKQLSLGFPPHFAHMSWVDRF
jgi:predicted acetyltransferase